MKKILFISKNKVLGQGLLAAIKARPELGLEWLPQFSYSEAAIGADVYHADVVILRQMFINTKTERYKKPGSHRKKEFL